MRGGESKIGWAAPALIALLGLWLAACLFYVQRWPLVLTDMTIEHTTQVVGLWHLAHLPDPTERLHALLQVGSYYPRLPGLLGLGCLRLFQPESIWSLKGLSLAWTMINGLALYGLLRGFASRPAALLGAAAWLSMPLVLCEARAYTWQTQMVACGTLALLAWSRSQGFTRLLPAALGGLAGALCLLSVRGLPYLLLALPALLMALAALRSARSERTMQRTLLGLALAGGLCLLPALPFSLKYLLTWGHRLGWQTFGQYPQGETQGASAPLFYFSGFFEQAAGPLLGAIVAAGLVLALLRRRGPLWLWAWGLGPLLALSCFGTKMVVYAVVSLPALAALAALGADALPQRIWRPAALVLLGLAAAASCAWYNLAGPRLSPLDPDAPRPGALRSPLLYEIADYAVVGDPAPAAALERTLAGTPDLSALIMLAGTGDDVGFKSLVVNLQYRRPATPLIILQPSFERYAPGQGRLWVIAVEDERRWGAARELRELAACLDRLKLRTYGVEQADQLLDALETLPVRGVARIELGPARFPLAVQRLDLQSAIPLPPPGLAWPGRRAAICLAGGKLVER